MEHAGLNIYRNKKIGAKLEWKITTFCWSESWGEKICNFFDRFFNYYWHFYQSLKRGNSISSYDLQPLQKKNWVYMFACNKSHDRYEISHTTATRNVCTMHLKLSQSFFHPPIAWDTRVHEVIMTCRICVFFLLFWPHSVKSFPLFISILFSHVQEMLETVRKFLRNNVSM